MERAGARLLAEHRTVGAMGLVWGSAGVGACAPCACSGGWAALRPTRPMVWCLIDYMEPMSAGAPLRRRLSEGVDHVLHRKNPGWAFPASVRAGRTRLIGFTDSHPGGSFSERSALLTAVAGSRRDLGGPPCSNRFSEQPQPGEARQQLGLAARRNIAAAAARFRSSGETALIWCPPWAGKRRP